MGAVSAWADATRTPARAQPAWVRILASVFLAAVVGWIGEQLFPEWPLWLVGALAGAAAGLLGARARKLLLGLAVGLVVGWILEETAAEVGWAVVAALAVAAYRTVAALLYKDREQVTFLAEGVEATDVPFVVPLVEQQGYVGVDYLRRFADRTGGAFVHSPPDIGILDSLDQLAGPRFDPAEAHPLIREFYEHTSRFRLAIIPHWRPWMKLPYLIYRRTVAAPLGQANAPFDLEEVERGVVSWIDTVDLDHDGVPDFRAWVRAYEDSREPLYVGIYTVARLADTGYVSVGFPFPAGSFTATLLPSNHRQDGLLLSSRAGDFPGHYLSAVDPGTGEVSVAKLNSFDEEIDVYVEEGSLFTDHRFFLGGLEFMHLHYDIERP